MSPTESMTLPHELTKVKTMLSAQELELLYTLGRDRYAGRGDIIDGGAFLGGSTLALASGVRDNARAFDKRGRVHSYDRFVSDRFVPRFLDGYPEGTSTRPYYESVIADVASHVTVHEGDITTMPWPTDRAIEILFIDVAKTWEINDFILEQFFPRLIPGVSTIIQQDYHWPHAPWISITMEVLAGHVTYLGSMPWATAYYRWERPLEPGELPARLRDLGNDRLRELANRAQRFEPGSQEWAAQQCNLVWLSLSQGRLDEAAAIYDATVSAAPKWIEGFDYRPPQLVGRARGGMSTPPVVSPQSIGASPNGSVGAAPATPDETKRPEPVSRDSVAYGMVGRALYERFISTPDQLLAAYAGLDPATETDSYVQDFAQVRARVSEAVARWRSSEPRVFVYGAGEHTRMLLGLCPELGPYVEGFIDRHAGTRVLGKPCVTPEEFRREMADAVVYSSRAWEHEMYERLKEVPVEHLLLYRESPESPESTTTTRVRNRFSETAADPEALRLMFKPPKWTRGTISGSDATFLHEMIGALKPQTVVEIGVASGVSSAVILHALDRLPQAARRALYSCDTRSTCYFDTAYATGQACRDMYPTPRATWHTEFAGDARALSARLPADGVDLTFIDANHSHPYPLLDLLQVTSFAKPGSWVILHDVDLPIKHPDCQIYGPRWLFHQWPFNKIKAFDRWASIAAVQLPEDPSQLVPMALALVAKPLEMAVPVAAAAALPPAFAAVQAALEAQARRPALVAK